MPPKTPPHLEKVDVPIRLFKGIDTKSDQFVVLDGQLTDLQNGEHSTIGALKKRRQYTAQTLNILPSGTLSEAVAISKRKDERLLWSTAGMYGYASQYNKWILKSKDWTVNIKAVPDGRSYKGIIMGQPTCMSVGYAVVVVYLTFGDTTDYVTLRYNVYNSLTGDIIQEGKKIKGYGNLSAANAANRTRVSLMQFSTDKIGIIAIDDMGATAEISLWYIDEDDPTTLSPVGNIVTTAHTDCVFEVAPIDVTTGILCFKHSGGNLALQKFTISGASGATTTTAFPVGQCIGALHTGSAGSSTDCTHMVFSDASQNVEIYGVADDLTTVRFANATIDTTLTASTIRQACGVVDPGKSDTVYWVYSCQGGALDRVKTCSTQLTNGSVAGQQILKYWSYIVTRPWAALSNTEIHVALGYGITSGAVPDFQYPTGFVVKCSYYDPGHVSLATNFGRIVARFLPASNWNPENAASSSQWYGLNNGGRAKGLQNGVQKFWVVEETGSIINSAARTLGITRVTLDYAPTLPHAGVEYGDALQMVGGYLKQYDGVSVFENGFLIPPPDVTLTQSASGGSMSDGTYQICTVLEYRDAAGNLHRSMPSNAQTITIPPSTSTGKITVTVRSNPYTNHSYYNSASGRILIGIYRTEDGESTFYRCGSVYSDDELTISQNIDVTESDATLVGQQLLYTTGGILAAEQPPQPQAVATYGSRLAVLDDRRRVWFSKDRVAGLAPEFSSSLVVPLGCDWMGDAVAAAELDGRLIVFSENGIQKISGRGPGTTGLGGTFGDPLIVSRDIGAKADTPIVATDSGIYFISQGGIAMLGRDMQIQWIGLPVASYASLTFTGAVHVPKRNRVVFSSSDGRTLAWDYIAQMWATWTPPQSVGAALWDNEHAIVESDGQALLQATTGNFTDGGSGGDIALDVTTGWIHLGKLQGFQRLYEILLFVRKQSAHTINVDIFQDYEATKRETVSLAYAGTAGDGFPLSFRVATEQCKAVKLRIYDSAQSGTKEGVQLLEVMLRIGAKPGGLKLPTAYRVE